jgi:hypothetical protein
MRRNFTEAQEFAQSLGDLAAQQTKSLLRASPGGIQAWISRVKAFNEPRRAACTGQGRAT